MGADIFRFVGLAFASADLLLEIDHAGGVVFAAGAGKALLGRDDQSLTGLPWGSLFIEADQPVVEALTAGLAAGERRGPVNVALAGAAGAAANANANAMISVFRLPENAPRVSCALTLVSRPAADPRDGALFDRTGFETVARRLIDAARITGPALELGLIELEGLAEARGGLADADARALDARISGALRVEAYADAAADLGDSRFAVLRRDDGAADALAPRLGRMLGAALKPRAQAIAIDPQSGAARAMRALRYAIDGFIAGGDPARAGSLADVLRHTVHKTVAEAGAFGAMVEQRRFDLVYQPVVSLKDGTADHFEALVRFSGEASPFSMIRMAEELDIIEALDCAVADEVAKRLRADRTGKLRLAANVSGRTITSPSFMQAVSRLAEGGGLADRLMFEITESAAIDDLAIAQRHVRALQAMGLRVCLDDFGQGAASFAYLQQLAVDIVKVDGAYVRELTHSGRNDALIRHLVGLCRELKVETVAEMVEEEGVEAMLRKAGVDYAQGWLYGQPGPEPRAPLPRKHGHGPVAARRQGALEEWG